MKVILFCHNGHGILGRDSCISQDKIPLKLDFRQVTLLLFRPWVPRMCLVRW
jgi:hypothetical protein